MIDCHFRTERSGGARVGDEDAAAVAELKPAVAFQLAITGAGGVGVDAETACQFPRAGQFLAGKNLAREDAEHNLGDQLLTKGDLGAAIEPEAHDRFQVSGIRCQFAVYSPRHAVYAAVGVARALHRP